MRTRTIREGGVAVAWNAGATLLAALVASLVAIGGRVHDVPTSDEWTWVGAFALSFGLLVLGAWRRSGGDSAFVDMAFFMAVPIGCAAALAWRENGFVASAMVVTLVASVPCGWIFACASPIVRGLVARRVLVAILVGVVMALVTVAPAWRRPTFEAFRSEASRSLPPSSGPVPSVQFVAAQTRDSCRIEVRFDGRQRELDLWVSDEAGCSVRARAAPERGLILLFTETSQGGWFLNRALDSASLADVRVTPHLFSKHLAPWWGWTVLAVVALAAGLWASLAGSLQRRAPAPEAPSYWPMAAAITALLGAPLLGWLACTLIP